jgi:hypothetical protein
MRVEERALAEEATKNADPADAATLAARCAGGWRLGSDFFGEEAAGDVVTGREGEPPREVLVGGQPVVREGRLVHGDVEEIRAHAREEAARLWARMAGLG